MLRVLVTGGAGFIGSTVIKTLLAGADTEVICVDNFDDTYERKFKIDNIVGLQNSGRFQLHEIDITDKQKLDEVFAETSPTHVLHLAAKADTRNAVENPYEYIDTNIIGTLNIFEVALKNNIKHVVAASSSSVYGNNLSVPWREADRELDPLSPYGVTKLSTEHLAYTYHKNHGLSVTMLRYFNAYGEHNRPNMVPYIWTEALLTGQPIKISGDGSRRRDYTYVGDIARGSILALNTPLGYQIINLGYGSPLSLNELLEMLQEATGKSVEVTSRPSHSASVEETYADTTKAKELLGWKPEVSHQEGMKRLVSWFIDHRLHK